jgi:uncharacterized protein YndB with AHSA1/START domain
LSAAPDVLFAYWTQSDLIRKWWPQRNWHLRGNYTAFEPGKKLAFTWRWDHDPEHIPVTEVVIAFVPLTDGGTRMTLTHDHFSDSAEGQEMRLSHLEGWEYFIGKLQDLKPA